MNTDGNGLKHYEITRSVIGSFYQVYKELGQGFLEAVYVEALTLVLRTEGLSVYREMPVKVYFRGHVIGRFRADVVVNGKVLVEVKALPRLETDAWSTNTELLASNRAGGGPFVEFWSPAPIQTASI